MRKSPELDALLPQTRQQVLSATLLQPERWWYLSELAQFLHVTPSTLQREVLHLSQAGILEQRADGNRTYYRCNQQSPVVTDLQNLLVKTVGVIGLLKQALKNFSKQIEVAFIFGSFAQSRELATSDIDVMIVGSLGLAQLSSTLTKLETRVWPPHQPRYLELRRSQAKARYKPPFLG